MAGHEWEDWFEREELIGQISDIRVQNLQVEREVVQKRTFTRWMNLHLEKCNPPMEVHDLFRDIQDGRVLMALLEELSGCKLLHGFKPSSHRIFRLNNIAKVLTFLEERNVKLVSIDAADVADGNSSIVLGLIWNIILFFQIKELTGNIKSQFPSSSSLSSIPTSSDSDTSYSSTPSEERRPSSAARDHGKAIKTLLQWVQRRTRKYGVAVQDFGKSWTSGLAFLAVIKSIDTSLVDMRRALLRSPRENIEDAFRTAHYSLGIPRLLEPEDVTVHPDEQSIMIYVSQFLEHFPGMDEEEVTERSKNSSRLNDPMVRNGVQRKREKSYVVRRDWVQPPPKIFISTVSDDQGPPVSSPVLSQTPEDRPWASDGSSVASSPSPADDRSLSQSLDLNKDVSFTVSSSSSPQPSFVDSVIDSPDSWDEMPSEVAPLDKLQQSQSDDSLNETNVVGDMKSSHSASEGKHDQELSGDLKRTSQEQTDTELFIDEGNFSISSVESLQAKSTAFPGDGGVHRDVFDVNEEGSASKVPNQENVMTSSMPNSETVMEASNDISHVDSDSGYFPDQRETSPASFTENLSRSQEQEAAFENKVDSNFECHAKPLESSSYLQNSDSVQNDPAEISDKPGESTGAIKDEVTSECPVQDEKVPPFGSVDDTMPVCTALSESEAQNVKHVLNAHVEPKGNETHEDAHVPQTHLEEREEKDKTAIFDCQQQKPGPEPEQRFTHLEASEKQASAEPDFNQRLLHHKELDSQDKETSSQTKEVDSTAETEESNMYGGLDMKDVKNSTPDDAAELGMIKPEVPPEPAKADLEDLNLKQTSEPAQFNEGMLANGDTAIPLTEHKLEDKINGTYSLSEHEPRGLQSMTDTESSWTESKSEDVPDGTDHKSRDEHRGTECETKGEDSCNVNNDNEPNDSQSQAADRKEQGEANTNMNVSVIPLDMVYYPHYDVPISKAIEADVKPNPDPALCPDGELRPASPQLHSPKDSMEQRTDGQNEGQTTAEEISPEEPEENPTELRLSLSVTPLQPAPTQHSLPDYESDTEETLPRHSEDITLGKSAEDSPELRVQSTGETHTSVEHSELDKTDEGPVAARENMETVREETVHVNAEDERQFPSVRKCTNCKTTIVRKSQNTNTDERKETKTPSQESPPEMLMDEMYLLLMAWLLLYCLFVLPQMEIQTLPHFLLNLDE